MNGISLDGIARRKHTCVLGFFSVTRSFLVKLLFLVDGIIHIVLVAHILIAHISAQGQASARS